jgi:hypothetical protein
MIDQLLPEVLKNGPYAVVMVLSIALNIFLIKALTKSYDDRVNDIKDVNTNIMAVLEAIKKTGEFTLTILQSLSTKK